MPGFREVLIYQGTQLASSAAAESIRTRKAGGDEPAKPPERPALKAAEELIARHNNEPLEPTEPGHPEPPLPADVFAEVEGREAEKQLLERALRSGLPVHVLMVGSPGCGKSELLQAIAKLPHSRYAVGGATSSSGMLDFLLEKPNTKRLVIDELDKADPADLYALYSLMESGSAPRLQHGKTEVVTWKGWVFAASNSTDKLPPALASRFVIRQVPDYTQAQMREISTRILERREGLSHARAAEIAAAIAPRSQDPRDAVQVARLAGESGPLAPVLAEVLPRR